MAAVSQEGLVARQRPSDVGKVPDKMRELEAAEIAVLNHRLALTELAESILREQLEREREQADKERERAERLEVEPQAERQRGLWSRLFGGRG